MSDAEEEVSGPPRKKQRLECSSDEAMSPSLGTRREISGILEPCYAWVRSGVFSYPSYHLSYTEERKVMKEALARLASAVEDPDQALDLLDFFTDKVLAIQHLSGHYRKRETFDTCIFPQENWDQLGELWAKAVGQESLSIQGFEHVNKTQSYQLLAMKLEGLLYEGRGAFVGPKLFCWRRYWECVLRQNQDDVIATALESFSETRPYEVLGLKETLRSAGLAIAITQGQGGIFKPATGALCLLQLLPKVRVGTQEGGSLYRALDVCRKALHRALCEVLRWPFPLPTTNGVVAAPLEAVKGGTRVPAEELRRPPEATLEKPAGVTDAKKSRGGTLADLTEALVAKNVMELDESVLSKGRVVDSVVEATQGSRRIIAHCIAYEMQENASNWTAEDAFLLAQNMTECGFTEPAFRAGLAALKAIKRWPPTGALHWIIVQSQAPGLHDPRARLQSILDLLKPGNVTGNEMVRTIWQLSEDGQPAAARSLAELFVTRGWPRDVDVLCGPTYVRGMNVVLDAWLAGEDDAGVLTRVSAVTTSVAAVRCWLEVAKRMEATGRHSCMFRLCTENALATGLRDSGFAVVYWDGIDWIMTKAVGFLNTDVAVKLVTWLEDQIAADDECGADLIRNAHRLARAAATGLGNVKLWRQLAVRVLELAHDQLELSSHWWREAVAVWRLLGPCSAKKLAGVVEKKGPEFRDEALALARMLADQGGFPSVVSAAWRRALRLLFKEAKQHAGSTAVWHLDAALEALEECIEIRLCVTAHVTQRGRERCNDCRLQRADVAAGLKLAEKACKAWKLSSKYSEIKTRAEERGW